MKLSPSHFILSSNNFHFFGVQINFTDSSDDKQTENGRVLALPLPPLANMKYD